MINIVNCHLAPVMKVWNNELEAIAQRWADQCFNMPHAPITHDDNRGRIKLDGTRVTIGAFATNRFPLGL